MVETSDKEEKEFGLLIGPRATFDFEKYAFIGFYGQIDKDGQIVHIGVLEDHCSERQWLAIRKQEAFQNNPVILDSTTDLEDPTLSNLLPSNIVEDASETNNVVTDPDDESATDENLIVEERCEDQGDADCVEDNPSNKIIDIDETNVVIDESLKDDDEESTQSSSNGDSSDTEAAPSDEEEQ